MSIIYQALKKVEDEERLKPSPRDRKRWLALSLLLTISVIFLLAWGISYLNKRKALLSEIKLEGKEELSREESLSYFEESHMPTSYTLEGIIYDEHNPSAIINGKILKKQDKIGDLKVINITPTTVELLNLKENTKFTLSF
jgi:hypothetical protein